MKINQIIKEMQKIQAQHGNVEVMFQDGNGDSYWSVNKIGLHVTEKDEFPRDWKMPAGFRFCKILN